MPMSPSASLTEPNATEFASMAAKRLPTWAAACLLVAAATDECHAPSTNTYTMDPPAATYPARPLRELTTPVAAILRWLGNDEAQLAACLGTLRATLPRARITIAARDMERARRVGARFEVERVVGVDGVPTLTTGQVVVADASVVFQPDATRRRLVSMKGCAAAGRRFAVGDAQSVAGWLRGGDCSESTTGLILADGCAHSNAFGEVVENDLPYFALLNPARDCPWRPTLMARLQTFSAVCAKPPCAVPLSRVKNRKRTQQLLDTHGLNDKTGADAAIELRQRRPLFAAPYHNKTQTTDCLLMGAGDYKDPQVYATFLRSLRGGLGLRRDALHERRRLSTYSIYFQQIQREVAPLFAGTVDGPVRRRGPANKPSRRHRVWVGRRRRYVLGSSAAI